MAGSGRPGFRQGRQGRQVGWKVLAGVEARLTPPWRRAAPGQRRRQVRSGLGQGGLSRFLLAPLGLSGGLLPSRLGRVRFLPPLLSLSVALRLPARVAQDRAAGEKHEHGDGRAAYTAGR